MKNTHLEHLEDNILNGGSQGGREAVAFLRSLGDMLDKLQRFVYVLQSYHCNMQSVILKCLHANESWFTIMYLFLL